MKRQEVGGLKGGRRGEGKEAWGARSKGGGRKKFVTNYGRKAGRKIGGILKVPLGL